MYLEIITPDQKIFSGDVDLIKVPGTRGSFEILEYHAPIISTLGKGKVKILEKTLKSLFEISGGVIEVKENNVIILAESINKIE
ncbi:MAG: ATP synthase F1 subunit epsilon [Bacteroidales bacterium]|nr:ATP synthase F1 subunit epsilon [Bacteroidales bacterium]